VRLTLRYKQGLEKHDEKARRTGFMHIFWYLPLDVDGRYIGTTVGQRLPDYKYLKQITQAVDHLGYEGMLLATGYQNDPWVVATALIESTERLKFLIAHRPSILPPALTARMAATFDRISNGRCLLNIVSSGGALQSDGVFQSHDELYELADEWLTIYRRLFTESSVSFQGKHLQIENGIQRLRPVQAPYPGLYFGGSSPAAIEVAAKHVDMYLTWGEPPQMAAEKFERVRRAAAKHGRTVRFGVRAQVIVRETEAEAYEAAYRTISHLDEAAVANIQRSMANSLSEGQRRIQALHGGDLSKLDIYPNLWGGIGLVRGGAGTAFVGGPQEVVRLMNEYVEAGADTFVLSGYPHLEEAYQFAELVFPHIQLEYDDPTAARAALEANGAGNPHLIDLIEQPETTGAGTVR
jgi:alkanesulfonate monooxygenase